MSISTAPDEYQACMEKIFSDLSFIVVYLDDVLVFSATPEEQFEHLRIALEQLTRFDVLLNGKVSYFTTGGRLPRIYPVFRRDRAASEKDPSHFEDCHPAKQEGITSFLEMIKYYRDMIHNKTSLCKPLHRFICRKISFTWLQSDTAAFKTIQHTLAEAVLLAFPDFKKPLHVYADASGTQLGSIIMQESKILACYYQSLSKHQLNYTVTEFKLLSIVELLHEYRIMLLGFR